MTAGMAFLVALVVLAGTKSRQRVPHVRPADDGAAGDLSLLNLLLAKLGL